VQIGDHPGQPVSFETAIQALPPGPPAQESALSTTTSALPFPAARLRGLDRRGF